MTARLQPSLDQRAELILRARRGACDRRRKSSPSRQGHLLSRAESFALRSSRHYAFGP